MTIPRKKPLDIERDRLLIRMRAAKESENKQEVDDCLTEAKRRLRKTTSATTRSEGFRANY